MRTWSLPGYQRHEKLTDRLSDKNALKEDVAESGEVSQPALAFEPLCLCLLREEEAKGFSVDLR